MIAKIHNFFENCKYLSDFLFKMYDFFVYVTFFYYLAKIFPIICIFHFFLVSLHSYLKMPHGSYEQRDRK